LAKELGRTAPVYQYTRDTRHPTPLKDSFFAQKGAAAYEYDVMTSEAEKFVFVTRGTQPPSAGTGYIFPRRGSALAWNKDRGPVVVRWVGSPFTNPHPGITRRNPFAEKAIARFSQRSWDGQSAPEIALNTTNWLAESVTNQIGIGGWSGQLGASILHEIEAGGE